MKHNLCCERSDVSYDLSYTIRNIFLGLRILSLFEWCCSCNELFPILVTYTHLRTVIWLLFPGGPLSDIEMEILESMDTLLGGMLD